ncbi:MAG: chemotaxis protein CheA [Trichlorobacter sp.]|uniref:chemotaxis protein CheA n=1 Tax=Trichlorobacter sp. TaxID=2911007 RepID=UPI0025625BE3|nr:chemotaxis protein CheA [Trichlorobacter sp.]MDK9717197.1 chemotaxis protein CheA [Trichlorobacter sp.]
MSSSSVPSSDAARDFLAEAEEIVEELGTQLADLADMAERGTLEPDLLNAIFRGAHSLKGLAGMFGFGMIAEVAHHAENLLDWLRMGKVSLTPEVLELLFASAELLTSLLRACVDGALDQHQAAATAHAAAISAYLNPTAPAVAAPLLEQLGLSESLMGALTEYEEHRLKENCSKGRHIYVVHASFELTTFDQGLSQVTDILKSCGEVISTLPSVGENMETHIDFDLLAGSDRNEQEFAALLKDLDVSIQVAGSAVAVSQSEPAPVSAPAVPEVEAVAISPDKAGIPAKLPVLEGAAASADEPLTAKSMSRTVRVDIGKLDELMNIVGELVLAHSSISSIANRMRAEGFSRMAIDLGKAAKGLERRLTDLQKGVMDIRMIPVGQLYEKMSRIVRKVSREQGKKIELKMYGAETELDKLIVEDIADPLMHIIRNAIDHGIESPERRLAAGKDERGTVRLSSFQKGNHVVIEVEDDGGGIDIEKIKQKALSKGLVQDVNGMTDREALDLIFMPGFSTADTITDISGRGVGMDVVRNNIAAVSGMVDIETRLGQGSRFTIVLPITLAIIKVLIIFCAGRTYAVPITSVVESLILEPADIKTVEGKEVINLREQTLPLLRLERLFNIDRIGINPGDQYVVIVGSAEKRLGLVVDDLLGQQDIVIKPLGTAFKALRGISGAADLGDQRTILVLDAGGIIGETMRSGGA